MNRGSFLSSASLAAIAAGTANAATTIPGGSNFVERKANFDAAGFIRAVNKPENIRQVWEAVAFHPALFNNIKNGLNGLHFGYGYRPDRITVVFAPHGQSSAVTYADASAPAAPSDVGVAVTPSADAFGVSWTDNSDNETAEMSLGNPRIFIAPPSAKLCAGHRKVKQNASARQALSRAVACASLPSSAASSSPSASPRRSSRVRRVPQEIR